MFAWKGFLVRYIDKIKKSIYSLEKVSERVLFPTRVCNTSQEQDQTVDNNNMPTRTDNSAVRLRGAGTPGS